MQVFNSFQDMAAGTGALRQPQGVMSVFNMSAEQAKMIANTARQHSEIMDDIYNDVLMEDDLFDPDSGELIGDERVSTIAQLADAASDASWKLFEAAKDYRPIPVSPRGGTMLPPPGV